MVANIKNKILSSFGFKIDKTIKMKYPVWTGQPTKTGSKYCNATRQLTIKRTMISGLLAFDHWHTLSQIWNK